MPRDPRTWMWAEAVELLDRAERMHRQFFRRVAVPSRAPTWEPPVDVFETRDAIVILIALPGVPADSIEVGIDGGTLIVAGDRPIPALRGAHIHRLEIPHGRFERRLELSHGRLEFGDQVLVNGCLTLQLRKL